MATTTLYRIIDTDRCGQILANSIPSLDQANDLLALLRKDYPDLILAVESYTVNENTD
jgi:hypothetical protein